MTDVATRIRGLSPTAKRALLAEVLKRQKARDEWAPLSYAQQRLWFLGQLVSGNPFYNELSAVRFLVPLDIVALEKALNEIVRRHEALRTVFLSMNGEPLQRILPPRPLHFPIVDFSDLSHDEAESEAQRKLAEQARTPFDIANGPLLRAAVYRFAPADHILAVTMHHIVCDGWSMKVFFNELRDLYAAFSQGLPSPLPELPIQYKDFTLWQREWLQGQVMDRQLNFWRSRLAGLPTLDLLTDNRRPDVPTFSGAREPLYIEPHVNHALGALSERMSVTPFMALLAAFQVMLYRYTGQVDIAVGCPVANRNRPELEKLIGFFVNTLVMRTDLSGDPTFREVLQRVREVALSAYAHQDLPFEKLVEELQPKRDVSRNPLFQVTFQILNEREHAEGSDQVQAIEVEQSTSKFDLRCDLWYRDEGIAGQIEYSTDLFEKETASLIARHFEALVAALVADPEQQISALPLPRNEQQKLRAWNQTTRSESDVSCVHERFEKVAESDPGQIAVVDGAHSITYGDLNKRANQLARYLRRRGIQPGCFVAVLLNRSIDLIVSVLAVLKAGAAYIPSDPKYPRERLSVALREAFVPLVISRSEFGDAVPAFITPFRMDADWDAVAREDSSNLPKLIDAQSLAYVIFTSGSNGKPRGVEVFHSGLSNLVNWHQQEYRITSDDRATLYASPGFDASVWEMWPYLAAGASLHIPDAESHASPVALAKWMAEQGVTISFLPTPVAESFVELDFSEALTLRVLLTGGDKLRHFPTRHLPFRFVNHYGPTEGTVVATAGNVPSSSSLGAPPIGKPISNVHAFVLDREGRRVPIGAKGELYIGGAGIARGYLNQAQLTREKFVTNPFDSRSGSRLYRTGDLVRFRSDGNLEFHGRIDDQLKIRGFRVEPAEIESVLDQYPAVDKSLVIAADNQLGEKTLTAYVVPKKLDSGNDPDFVTRLQAEHINEWQQIYEQLYGSNHRERDPSFDIIGWNNSYTGEPLSRAEMEEQVSATVARIAALRANNILEIGCGTGLLLLRLAGNCKRYVGTDFSKASLLQVEEVVRERQWSHVELYQRLADEFREEDANSFDVVVLNSVVQYFPHMDYLVTVLENASRMLRPGGFIFVGDVRSLPLLGLLHAGVEITRAGDCTAGELRARIAKRLEADKELVIHPHFFTALAKRLERISGVSIEIRRGWRHNELTRFRYDAVLQISSEPDAQSSDEIEWQEREWETLGTLDALREHLGTNSPSVLVVRRVPSSRLWTERLKLQRLEQAEDKTPVSSLRFEELGAETTYGVEPEELWKIEAELPYRVQVEWAEPPDSCAYDVKFVARSFLTTPSIMKRRVDERADEYSKPWRSYGNEVTKKLSEQYATHALRQYARQWLPEYMVPGRVVWLDELPLTVNGKLNRAALANSDKAAHHSKPTHEAPQNDVESKLAGIWQEVLGLESVSIHENFFDVGGHSLLLVRLHSSMKQLFDTSISLIDLFRLSSIRAMARALIAESGQTAFASKAWESVPPRRSGWVRSP